MKSHDFRIRIKALSSTVMNGSIGPIARLGDDGGDARLLALECMGNSSRIVSPAELRSAMHGSKDKAGFWPDSCARFSQSVVLESGLGAPRNPVRANLSLGWAANWHGRFG